MRRIVIVGLAILAISATGLGIWWYQSSFKTGPEGEQTLVRSAPDFALKDAAGKTHRLSDYKGQPVILHFWAEWCPPCLEEIPQWIAAAKKAEGKRVRWIAVSLDDAWEAAHKILPAKDLPSNVISLLDPVKEVPDQYGSYQFPETYLLTEDHKIVTKWIGPQDWSHPKIDEIIEVISRPSGAQPAK